jgi:hypothetical protein
MMWLLVTYPIITCVLCEPGWFQWKKRYLHLVCAVDFFISELHFSSRHSCRILILLQDFFCSAPDLSSLFAPFSSIFAVWLRDSILFLGLLCVCRPEHSRISFPRRAAAEGVSATGFFCPCARIGFPAHALPIFRAQSILLRSPVHRSAWARAREVRPRWVSVFPALHFSRWVLAAKPFCSCRPSSVVVCRHPAPFFSQIRFRSRCDRIPVGHARSFSIARCRQVDFRSHLFFESAAPVCPFREVRSSRRIQRVKFF